MSTIYTAEDAEYAARQAGQHAYPPDHMPEPMPMHQQVAMLGKEVADLRQSVNQVGEAVAHLRQVIARELGA